MPIDTATLPRKHQELHNHYRRHLATKDPPSHQPYIYLSYVRRFLEFAGHRSLNRATLDDFMEQLKTEGKKDSTRAFAFGVLRTFFRVNELHWPYGKGEAPKVRRGLVMKPALHPQVIADMIKLAVAGGYKPEEAACLALVTTYGLRREDIRRLRPDDLKVKEHLISFTEPAKRSKPRVQQVPVEILPYLQRWGGKPPLTINILGAMWYRLEQGVGMPHREGMGWHGIRRTLNTELRRAVHPETRLPVNPTSIEIFMGWSGESSRDETDRYISLEYMGYAESVIQQPMGQAQIDQEIFAVHPFLPFWRGHGQDTEGTGKKKSRTSRAH